MEKERGRKHRLVKNSISAIALQITNVLCGFVLPRAILKVYGSEVNGLLHSIAQFLQIIAFMELGVGAVVRSSLYKPLSENDDSEISRILASANKFFKKIFIILIAYVVVLCLIFPTFIDKAHGFLYDALLILTISISYFVQYGYGIVDRLLINADQKGYIQNNVGILSIIINTVLCFLLIHLGVPIHIVKLVTSLVYVIRTVYVRLYINKHYHIDRRIKLTEEPLKQKWNGIAQHIAAIVLDSTDIIVLSVFSTLSNVSIYSVYNMVVAGIRQLFDAVTAGISALFGELWVKQETDELNQYFARMESILHLCIVFIWICTAKLVVPFVSVYTSGVADIDYRVPAFSLLICIASACYCLRISYLCMILAAGHYKQTQHIFIIAAALNMSVSVILVLFYGLVGVAIGTIVGMLYQTLHMQYYCITKLKVYSYKHFIKVFAIDLITIGLVFVSTRSITLSDQKWLAWILMACKVCVVCFLEELAVCLVFERKLVKSLFHLLLRKFRRE